MMIASEIGWGCVLGSLAKAKEHPSGIPVPDTGISNAGLYHTRLKFIEFLGTLQEIAGGIVTTMPVEVDYRNEATRAWIDKYLRGSSKFATEDRMKLLYFIQDLTASVRRYLMRAHLRRRNPERTVESTHYDLREDENAGLSAPNVV
jgi:4-hydroxybutyryl-CoA dehydratase/vinylacetyl-CoA-Delta-isomerase